MKIKLDEVTFQSEDVEEWDFFIKLMEVMEPQYLIGILEHYDLENWL